MISVLFRCVALSCLMAVVAGDAACSWSPPRSEAQVFLTELIHDMQTQPESHWRSRIVEENGRIESALEVVAALPKGSFTVKIRDEFPFGGGYEATVQFAAGTTISADVYMIAGQPTRAFLGLDHENPGRLGRPQ